MGGSSWIFWAFDALFPIFGHLDISGHFLDFGLSLAGNFGRYFLDLLAFLKGPPVSLIPFQKCFQDLLRLAPAAAVDLRAASLAMCGSDRWV